MTCLTSVTKPCDLQKRGGGELVNVYCCFCVIYEYYCDQFNKHHPQRYEKLICLNKLVFHISEDDSEIELKHCASSKDN